MAITEGSNDFRSSAMSYGYSSDTVLTGCCRASVDGVEIYEESFFVFGSTSTVFPFPGV